VVIGSDGEALRFLRQAFPDLVTIEMPGRPVRYQRKGPLWPVLLRQMPSFLRSIQKDTLFVRQLIKQEPFRLIVSDNRYGCYHDTVPSVMLTHQLNLHLPSGLGWAEKPVNRWLRNRLKKFRQIWVPDFPGLTDSLSGTLSHPPPFIEKTFFIGPLSRFELSPPLSGSVRFDWLFLLSGPEPQRTQLENILLKKAADLEGYLALVRGTSGPVKRPVPDNVEVFDLLQDKELAGLLGASSRVLARCGYSTVMDLYVCGKPALFIPTPGQSEQEYLGKWLDGRFRFTVQKANRLELRQAKKTLSSMRRNQPAFPGFDTSTFQGAVDALGL